MSAGRCAGCGHTGSGTHVNHHVLTCPDYLSLFRECPEKCLTPVAEYERHRAMNTSEARAQRRDERLDQRFADLTRRYAHEVGRWTRPRDILED